MSSCLCSNVRRAARILSNLYDEALAPCGLRVMQLETLDALSDLGGATLMQLADANYHERSAVWRGLQPLIARGFVKLAPSKGRADRFEMTSQGRAVLKKALKCWQTAQRKVISRLGSDAEEVVKLIAKFDTLPVVPHRASAGRAKKH